MESNPYASPKPEGNASPYLARLLLRFVAVFLWLTSLFLVLGIVSIWNRPEIAARTADNPSLAAVVWAAGMILPALGFAILGLASWRRRWGLALLGLLAGFMPLVTFIAFFAIRRALR
jgi:hypothetical protein